MKKSLVILLLVFLAACSANSTTLPPTNFVPSETNAPSSDSLLPPLSNTLFPTSTLTATDPSNLVILDNMQPDLVSTALNFQIDEYEITLTAAAGQISTLDAQNETLAARKSPSSSSSSSLNSGYDIPADVIVATVIKSVVLETSKRDNDKGKPIMVQYQPKIKLEPGFQTWVFEDFVIADGGGRYYKVYDPDGESAADFYLRDSKIQVKLPNGTPPPGDYPGDVVKVRAINNARAFFISDYDSSGKPIMASFEPRIVYEVGDTALVHAKQVITTGNVIFYALYDPDGKSSLYLVGYKLEFLPIWD